MSPRFYSKLLFFIFFSYTVFINLEVLEVLERTQFLWKRLLDVGAVQGSGGGSIRVLPRRAADVFFVVFCCLHFN